MAPSSRPAEIPVERTNAFAVDTNNNVNNSKEEMMDATPIADVMMDDEPVAQAGLNQAPMHMLQPMSQQPIHQQPSIQQMQALGPQKAANPFNLTDAQMQALLVAGVAAIAFSGPVQDKLGTTVPNFIMNGERSTVGLVSSGAVAGVLFYLYQHFNTNA
jgi:hypothetical protein